MVQKDWSSFAEWEEIVKKNGRSVESSFDHMPLTKSSVFHWNQMSTPLPAGGTYGAWGIFPEPKALAGFLRFMVLPQFFEIWLVREEWDDDPERFVRAEELFDIAEKSGKCRYIEDVPVMKTLIADLDALMNQDNEKVTAGLNDVAKKFNDRWEDTPTWCFKVEVYNDPVAVGKEIFKRIAEDLEEEDIVEEFGMSEDDWMDICRKALTDESAQEQFTEKLSDSGWY